jgi:hypothetical protein
MAFFWGKRVSQMATFLLSELWPAVINEIIEIEYSNFQYTSYPLQLNCKSQGTQNQRWVYYDIHETVEEDN